MGVAGGSDRDRSVRLLRSGRPDRAPWHRLRRAGPGPPSDEAVELLAAAGERGLIVAGAGAGAPEAVWQLSTLTGWPVLGTPQSGCRATRSHRCGRCTFADGHRPRVAARPGPAARRLVGFPGGERMAGRTRRHPGAGRPGRGLGRPRPSPGRRGEHQSRSCCAAPRPKG